MATLDDSTDSILDDQTPEEAPLPPVTAERLRSLRALIEYRSEAGETDAVQVLTEKFRSEYDRFAEGKTEEEIDQALNKAP
jgi:hypothetical protein